MEDTKRSQHSRILIIDDDPSIHEDVRKVLSGEDVGEAVASNKALLFQEKAPQTNGCEFEIDSASRGEAGLGKVQQALALGHPYAMALVDVRMPSGWDGLETITQLWKAQPDLQIVLCTAYSDHSWEEIIHRLGTSDRLVILKKPFENIELRQLAYTLSARKQTEDDLRESEQRFRNLVAAAFEGICVSEHGRVLEANDQFLAMYGYERAEVIGREVQGFIAPESREFVAETIEAGHEGMYEYQALGKNGRAFEVEAQAKMVSWSGRPVRVAAVRDVTDRKVAERALREQRAKLDSILRAAPVGVAASNQRVFIDVNDFFCRMTGYTAQELIGQSARLLYPTEEDFDFVRRELYESLSRGDTTCYVETRWQRKDGQVIDILMGASRIDSVEQPTWVMVSALDITSQKRAQAALRDSEELYRTLVSASPNAITVADPDGAIVFLSPKAVELYGQASAAEFIGHSVMEWVAPEDHAKSTANLQRLLASGQLEDFECTLLRKDGTCFNAEVNGAVIRAANGNVRGIVLTSRDISDRKRTEAFLAAQGRLSQLLANASQRAEAARAITGILLELYHWDACFLSVYNARTNLVTDLLFFDTINGQRTTLSEGVVDALPSPLLQRLLCEGAQLILRQDEADAGPRTERFGDVSRPSKSLMYVPIRHRSENVGILSVQSYRRNAFTPGDLCTLQALADNCASTLSRLQAEDALRARQARLDSILRAAPAGIGVVVDRVLTEVNAGMSKLTGYESTELIGQSIRRLYATPEDFEQAGREVYGQLGAGSISTTESRWRHRNGRIIDVLLCASPIVLGDLPQGVTFIALDVTERRRAQTELEAASRQAGMAEVATSVLHNVGNVLNSVNISIDVIRKTARNSGAEEAAKVAALIEQHRDDVLGFLGQKDRAGQLFSCLKTLAEHLATQQATALQELQELAKNVDHIKDVVATQQTYAKGAGLTELVKLSEVVEDALGMHARALVRHNVQVIREYDPDTPQIILEKHKLVQILVNLISNAKHACDGADQSVKRLTLRVSRGGDGVRVSVTDNGVGIPAENLTKIFNHGFTTRKNGHGFGLHSAALAARELGGTLLAHSDGPGQGATLTVELPLRLPERTL